MSLKDTEKMGNKIETCFLTEEGQTVIEKLLLYPVLIFNNYFKHYKINYKQIFQTIN